MALLPHECTVTSTAGQPSVATPFRERAAGGFALELELPPGLYALTVEADGREFDWEELYVVFNKYGNVNQRTGPWDFDEHQQNRPVMPAYWVWLDGRKLGLWYFNRLSARQTLEKRFRGEFGFLLREGGRHTLEFVPYREFRVAWRECLLEPEPYDAFAPLPEIPPNLAEQLLPEQMPQNRFTEGYLASVAFAKEQVNTARNSGFQLPMLSAAWRWTGDPEALAAARQVIEAYLAMPVWGNPREDGYGHKGDMAAATPLFGLALALRWLGEDIADLRERTLATLQEKGHSFLEMALVQRAYWGGSILQDHGFVSFAWFACAAYCLHDVLPDARDWLAFGVHRMKRSLAAMPRDGVVPATSYHALWMYVDKLVLFRELHRLATGEDIYGQEAVRTVPAAARACFVPERCGFAFPSARGDLAYFDGAQAFLAQMSHDADARWLLERFFMEQNRRRCRTPYQEWHYQKDWLWAVLFAGRDSAAAPTVEEDEFVTAQWFRDSGVAVLRAGSSLAMAHGGPPCSQTSYENATCGCDRMIMAPLSGTFVYFHEGRRVLHNAEGGYRMSGEVGNILLVDGHGQRDDIGMPMSYPDAHYYGERVITASTDGVVMDLMPVYEGLVSYTRYLRLSAGGVLEVEDEVQPDGLRRLCWRFQTYRRNPWTQLGPGCWRLEVDGQTYEVRATVAGAQHSEAVGDTLTVWGYVNDNEDQYCHHLTVEAEAAGPVTLRLTVGPLD